MYGSGTEGRQRFRHLALWLWLALSPLVLVAWWYPIQFQSLRLLQVLSAVALWGGALSLFWNRRPVRLASGVVAALLMGAAVLPGRDVDAAKLRASYVRALRSYLGTVYLWGGESHRGIDCSGLGGAVSSTPSGGTACAPATPG